MEPTDASATHGSPTIRHAPRQTSWEPAGHGEADTLEAIDQHIERHFGPVAFVWHELVSDLVHIDVYVVEPTESRPYFSLVTSGMSDRPMAVPTGAGITPYAELMMALPADWPMTTEAFNDESTYWPIRTLKMVARLPHDYNTWIGAWHSVPNGDPAEPYASDTPFVGVVVTPMVRCEADARMIETEQGKQISLLALVPLHPAELDLKLAEGSSGLIGAFDGAAVSELFDPVRPSSV